MKTADPLHEVVLARGSGYVVTYDGVARTFTRGELVLRVGDPVCRHVEALQPGGNILNVEIGGLDLVNKENVLPPARFDFPDGKQLS